MSDGTFHVPHPVNEPVRAYAPGDAHRASLKARLKAMAAERIEIPCVIGGKEVRTGTKRQVVMPHSHREVLADFHVAGQPEMRAAVETAMKAKPAWAAMPWQDRAAIFLKAADLLAGPYRDILNCATMLGQSKNAYQAEIDSACELIDFLRFNAHFYQQILQTQPISSPGIWNRTDYRPLDGFVLAVTPFNFTAIAGNLPSTPAMLGNTVVWKPANTQMLAAHYTMQLFREAGLPDGVINLVPAQGAEIGRTLLPMRELAGVHFTGSTATFNSIWKTVSDNIANYGCYPRLVGETGGKDFVFAHPSADVDALVTALVRGAFEYQGQKCSAASRAYIPRSLWPRVQEQLIETIRALKMGDVRDFRNFVNAVIDQASFENIQGYLSHAKDSADARIVVGGNARMDTGYFVEPTVIEAKRPEYKSMVEEIFGPVLSVYVYEDAKLDETLKICDEGTPYALTGAIFSQDRYAVEKMSARLRGAAGNFYINDKPTGAVVGQQPFGGSRASGTNDKAGSALNLVRWLSPRSIKETFVPPKSVAYPFMSEE
ncbi:MAG: L-glutamate gamma-semialdehyde dehydrogenase [Oligoflexia bacterium]|nr:L-glutamate gamma-semialdehyde dehydrogenase [Oligoflexia bacterium]